MPRFVLLEHDHPTPHLDLLFEVDNVLWAWGLQELPADRGAVAAQRNFDHRLLYLDYEGPISGGRGRVRRVDRGDYDWIACGEENLEVVVRGRVLNGRLELVRRDGDQWRVEY